MKPFTKWAGSKQRLLTTLKINMPSRFNPKTDLFVEGFVGGGSLFFKLAPTNALLIDGSTELMNVYKLLKTDPQSLIDALKGFSDRHYALGGDRKKEEELYYQVREQDRTSDYDFYSDVHKAARLLYLMRTCFNGLPRWNSQGQFNCPWGKYKKPAILDEQLLLNAHLGLLGASLFCGDFLSCGVNLINQKRKALKLQPQNVFIYLDPPYQTEVEKDSFTAYGAYQFREREQRMLAKTFEELDALGYRVMLSNSYTSIIAELYKSFNRIEVVTTRSIAANGDRPKVKEYLITNYRSE